MLENPTIDWKLIWGRVRHPSLNASLTSFSFKLLHNLLPTEYRTSLFLPNPSSQCRYSCPGEPLGDLEHIFFKCKLSSDVGDWLSDRVREIDNLATETMILRMDFSGGDGLVWVVLATLSILWEFRNKGKHINLNECKAILMSELETLENTKHQNTYEVALQHILM